MPSRSLLPFGWESGRDLVSQRGADLFREMERLFGEVARRLPIAAAGGEAGAELTPRIDVSESETEWTVSAEMPGLDPSDLDVTLTDTVLTIKGEKKTEREEKEKDYHVMERSYGRFSRAIPLPFKADPEQVKASFAKGVLTVTVPKPAELKDQTRSIPVQTAA